MHWPLSHSLRILILASLFTVASGGTASASVVNDPATVEVMTWNVKTRDVSHGNPHNLAALIGNQEPDVVALQEICESELAQLRLQLRVQYEGLTYDFVAGGVRDARADTFPGFLYPGCGLGDREYGQAILSRHGIGGSETVLYPRTEGEQRGYMRTDVVVDPVSRATVSIFNTHIGFDKPDQQIATLLADVSDETAAIVAGDFNVEPAHPAISPLVEALDEVDPTGTVGTYPTPEGVKKIDYLFYRGITPAGQPATFETPSSDHQPLVSSFTVG